MMISRYFASIVIMAALCFVQKSYGSTFCATASRKMTDSTAQLDKAQASKISNAILNRLKKGDTNQYVPLNEDTYMGLESLFPEAKLRAGRTFFINAWDLNRLLEMQSKLDLVVIGKLSSDQIRKVEKALVGAVHLRSIASLVEHRPAESLDRSRSFCILQSKLAPKKHDALT